MSSFTNNGKFNQFDANDYLLLVLTFKDMKTSLGLVVFWDGSALGVDKEAVVG